MKRLAATFFMVFITWLILTYSLSLDFVITGIAVALIITIICRHLLSKDTPRIILHPKRWLGFIAYIGYMFYAGTVAHLDVMARIFSGRIKPAMVKVPVHFTTNLGKTLFGNSITLTPGTLTVNAEDEHAFIVHALAYSPKAEIGKPFHRHGKRVIR